MDDINALNSKLQSISRMLEATQAAGYKQEEVVSIVNTNNFITD